MLDRRAPRSPAAPRSRRRASRPGGGTPPSAGRSARSPRRGARRASGCGFVQIGVAIVPGSTIATWMPSGASSTRSESAIASSACFDIAYAPRNGSALLPAIEPTKTIRPFAARSAGRNACVTASWPTTFTSSWSAELVEREVLERRGDGDAGVVHEAVEAVDGRGGCGDRVGVGDVEDQLLCALRRVACLPHAGEHAAAAAANRRRARGADPRRRARDEDRLHARSSRAAGRRSLRAASPDSRRRPRSTAPACSSGAAGAPT